MRSRLIASAAVLVLLSFLVGLTVGKTLFGGSGAPSTYTGVVSDPGDPLFPNAPNPGMLVFSNTGKNIQQLVLDVTGKGTLALRFASAYMQMSEANGRINYTQGPVYVPERRTRPELLAYSGQHWTWNLGDLPTGYVMVVTVHLRRVRRLPRYGYLLYSKWYAMTSPDEPRRDWKQISGENAAFG